MRSVLLVLIGVEIVAISGSCAPSRTATSSIYSRVKDPHYPLSSQKNDLPFLFLHHFPGHPAQGERLSAGTIVAIWPNGTIVRAKSETEIGHTYIRGRLTSKQLDDVRSELGQSGLLKSSDRNPLVVDAASERVVIRWDGIVRQWAHSPGNEGTINSNSTNPKITALKSYLMALPVDHPAPEPPDAYAKFPQAWYR